MLTLGVALLLALAYLVGHGPPKSDDKLWEAVLVASAKTGPVVALVFVALLILAWSFRHLWLDWLAYRPGRIEVDTFTSGPKLSDADAEQLTLQFRERLASVRLQAPKPVPGAVSDGDFLEVLGRAGVDPRNVFASALGLLRAAKPQHAWQVQGVLVGRDEAPRYGLTVQVIQLPDQGNPPETVWGTSWEDAIQRGADYATAAILPRTRQCRTPWATWQRFVMPGTLLRAYEEAVYLERERRYDEALDAYGRASTEDPKNMALRLHIGQLQEKLALHLDALSTYDGMVEVGERRPTARGFAGEPRAAAAERRGALLAAKYRRLVLLGGSELADQWRRTGARDHGAWTARDRRRSELRCRLRGSLERRLSTLLEEDIKAAGRSRVGKRSPNQLLAEPDHENPRSKDEETVFTFELRELFALAALQEAKDCLGSWRDRTGVLSAKTVDLTALCIEVRLGWLQHKLRHGQACPWKPETGESLRERVEAIEGRGFQLWHEHYNAACVYALPLLDRTIGPDDPLRNDLAKRAVERLATATAHAESAHIAGRRDWVLSEDPDLDGLRTHTRFKDFEALYFPAEVRTAVRPKHPQKLESSRHVGDLVKNTSLFWERRWHARGRTLEEHPDVHTVLKWWDEECEAWDLVRNVALDYRHWRTRFELLERLHGWADEYRTEPLIVRFPRYEEKPFSEAELARERPDELGRKAIEAAELRMRAIHDAAPDMGEGGGAGEEVRSLKLLQSTFRELDAKGRAPRRFVLAALCDHHAALWQLLREWLVAPTGRDAVRAQEAFERQVGNTACVWEAAGAWWRNRVLLLAAARGGARPAAALGRRLIHMGDGPGADAPVVPQRN
jgi:hypothetical protein